MNKVRQLIMVVGVVLILLHLQGCVTPKDSPALPPRGFFMGILPIPGDDQPMEDAYAQAAQYAEFVPVWPAGTGASGFWDYPDKLRGWWGTTFVEGYIRGNGMFPLIHFSFMDKDESGNLILQTPDTMTNATLSNQEWRTLYIKSILEVVAAVKPLYLSTGNEVNRWYEAYGADADNPNGFQHFVSLHEEIYDAVKKISPETKVFCVFSREIVNENREADLSVLDFFDPATLDVLVFTSYPYAVKGILTPSDIPDDYYAAASQHMPGKPFGFSELGWPSLEVFGGEQGQADFLFNVADRLTVKQGISLHLYGYCWLHDVDEYDSTGLIKRDGTEKLAYLAWKEISGPKLPISERDFQMGVAGFVPRNYPNSSGDDWEDFFHELPEVGELFGVYVAWDDTAQIHTAMETGLVPIIAIGYQIENVDENYFDEYGEAYRDAIQEVVETYRPSYLAIGVEVNALKYRVSNQTFNDFVSFYKNAYDMVKEINPETRVFTIFQLELMKGAARLTGLHPEPHWEVIDAFENKLDLVGFTVYPFLEYEHVDDIPDDYYREIAEYVDAPLAFTEMGWPSNSSIVNGSEEDQITFLLGVINATRHLNVELMLYSFLHDAPFGVEPFETIGLKTNDGRKKMVYNYWCAVKNLPRTTTII